MSEEVIRKIYEINGILIAADELVIVNQEFEHPLLENISDKVRQLIGLIEKETVGETT